MYQPLCQAIHYCKPQEPYINLPTGKGCYCLDSIKEIFIIEFMNMHETYPLQEIYQTQNIT